MRFGFLITARCNAACTHCTTSCGPNETAALPHDRLLALMDEAAALWREHRADDEDLHLCISGGEPFLDLEGLLQLVAHGTALGATMSCVTNGYWAATDDKARRQLRALKAAGLRHLGVSTSRFHQQFVKARRVQRALDIARETGIRVTLKCALTRADRAVDGLEQWARASGADELEIFPVAPYLREGAQLEDDQYIRELQLPQGRCPQPTVTVKESGVAYTCCVPGGFVDFLALGNVRRASLAAIYQRFYRGEVQQALRHRGPAYFAGAIAAGGESHRLRERYESVCDLCAHIASDPVMAAIARDAARDFAEQRMTLTLAQLAAQNPSASGGNPPQRLEEGR